MRFPAANWRVLSKQRVVAFSILAAILACCLLIEKPIDLREIVSSFACLSMLFLIPSLPICLAVWFFGRKRVHWNKMDYLILVVPLLAHITLATVANVPKSLSNLIELFWLGVAVAFAPIIRVLLPKKWNGKLVAATLLVLGCIVAAGIYLFVPCLPE